MSTIGVAMIEFTEWATEILQKSQAAASRFNPDARIRLARVEGRVQAVLTDRPEEGDVPVEVGEMTLLVEAGLNGLVDIEEPHDRLVLRPAGSVPNPRGSHESS
jgi:hypothetical protein